MNTTIDLANLRVPGIFVLGGIVSILIGIIGEIRGTIIINVQLETRLLLIAVGFLFLAIGILFERSQKNYPLHELQVKKGETKGEAKENGKTKP